MDLNSISSLKKRKTENVTNLIDSFLSCKRRECLCVVCYGDHIGSSGAAAFKKTPSIIELKKSIVCFV